MEGVTDPLVCTPLSCVPSCSHRMEGTLREHGRGGLRARGFQRLTSVPASSLDGRGSAVRVRQRGSSPCESETSVACPGAAQEKVGGDR
jgi:hypothetical protein